MQSLEGPIWLIERPALMVTESALHPFVWSKLWVGSLNFKRLNVQRCNANLGTPNTIPITLLYFHRLNHSIWMLYNACFYLTKIICLVNTQILCRKNGTAFISLWSMNFRHPTSLPNCQTANTVDKYGRIVGFQLLQLCHIEHRELHSQEPHMPKHIPGEKDCNLENWFLEFLDYITRFK